MVATRKNSDAAKPTRRPPATTPEGRENQMVNLAVSLAEKQLAEGTASSQVIVHYLKLATSREKLEQEKLAREVALLKAREENMASLKGSEDMYKNALEAMRSYSGQQVVPDDDY